MEYGWTGSERRIVARFGVLVCIYVSCFMFKFAFVCFSYLKNNKLSIHLLSVKVKKIIYHVPVEFE